MGAKVTFHNGPADTSRGKQLLPILPLLLAGTAVVFGLNARMEAIRADAEQQTLAPIVRMYGIRSDASKYEIYDRIYLAQQDHEVACKARIAEHLGVVLDWKQIFGLIEKKPKPDRSQIIQEIATDFSLPKDMPLEVMKRSFTKQKDMPTHAAFP